LDRITTASKLLQTGLRKRSIPVRDESQIFRALLGGQHMIRGFSNPDIRKILKDPPHLKDITDALRQSAKVTRIFNRCHAHGLIAKIAHSRRWRLTKQGRIAMTASIQLRDIQFPITVGKIVCDGTVLSRGTTVCA
jgi:hypothetical protein